MHHGILLGILYVSYKEKFFLHTLSFNQDITKTAKYLCIYSVQYGFKQLLSFFHRDIVKDASSNRLHRSIVMNSEKGNCFISIITRR